MENSFRRLEAGVYW